MLRRILGPAVATVLVAAAGILAAPGPPATAAALAACSGATGVTVVVDYNEIGGPTRAGCDPDGGDESAAQVFPDAGFSLEYHPRQPGYVCKVTGLPDDRPCLENDSFWSLWWSDGKNGRWVFANQGVGSLSVPDGGYVAWSWHEGGGNAQPPDAVPTVHESTDQPTQQQSGGTGGNGGHKDGNGGNGGAGNGGGADNDDAATDDGVLTAPTATTDATSSASSKPSASTSAKPRKKRDRASDDAVVSPSTSASTDLPAVDEISAGPPESDLSTEPSDDDSALPTWIGLGLAVIVLGAACVVLLLRRRERAGPPA